RSCRTLSGPRKPSIRSRRYRSSTSSSKRWTSRTSAVPSIIGRRAYRNGRRVTLGPGEADMRTLVTGAASGIGRATCLRLARDARARGQAAKIAAVDFVPLRELDSLREELRKLDAEAL